MGLSLELTRASKLTPEIIFKGPKNLQLQQCKRILLELELGIMRLRKVEAVPRPFRRRRKEDEQQEDNNKSQVENQDLVDRFIHSEGGGQKSGGTSCQFDGRELEDGSSAEDHDRGSD